MLARSITAITALALVVLSIIECFTAKRWLLSVVVGESKNASSAALSMRNAPACSNRSLRPRRGRELMMTLTDHNQKLLLTSAPKAGATISTMLMLRHWGLLKTARNYSRWIHDYRVEVLRHQPRHRLVPCSQVCSSSNSSWLCIKIVRSPLDRVVSSYIHTMNTPIAEHFPELATVAQKHGVPVTTSTFAMFVEALELRVATTPLEQKKVDDHFMPQTDLHCNDASTIHFIPTEALSGALEWIHETQGVLLNASGLTSNHYMTQEASTRTTTLPDASRLLPPNKTVSKVALPYDAYFVNPDIAAAVCRLFCGDLRLYGQHACGARKKDTRGIWEQRVQPICDSERARVRHICGPSYDFF